MADPLPFETPDLLFAHRSDLDVYQDGGETTPAITIDDPVQVWKNTYSSTGPDYDLVTLDLQPTIGTHLGVHFGIEPAPIMLYNIGAIGVRHLFFKFLLDSNNTPTVPILGTSGYSLMASGGQFIVTTLSDGVATSPLPSFGNIVFYEWIFDGADSFYSVNGSPLVPFTLVDINPFQIYGLSGIDGEYFGVIGFNEPTDASNRLNCYEWLGLLIEFGSGGSRAAGTAINQVQKSVSGGAVANSSALNMATFNHIASGGSILASSALTSKITDHTASGGTLVNGYVTIAETISVGGTALLNSSAFLTMGFDPSGGIVLNGLSPFFGPMTLAIESAGVLAEGSAIREDSPNISGGSLAAGLALVSTAILMQGGIAVAGEAIETFKPLIGGVKLSSRTVESVTYYSNRFRAHRFQIGNTIFVLSQFTNRYVRQSILERLTVSNKDYWRVGMGWYSDKSVLSYDEFKLWRQRN